MFLKIVKLKPLVCETITASFFSGEGGGLKSHQVNCFEGESLHDHHVTTPRRDCLM